MAVANRVYAEALLSAAKEADALARVREDFGDFVAAVEDSDELRDFLRNPQVEPGVKRRVLESLLEGADERFVNFARLLAEKNRVVNAADVHREFERLIAEEERVLELELVTAVELSDDEAGSRAPGAEVMLSWQEQHSLIVEEPAAPLDESS